MLMPDVIAGFYQLFFSSKNPAVSWEIILNIYKYTLFLCMHNTLEEK